ncbi:MAG: hypothetical protein H6907_17965 [Hyphomicrobiales bacterium]|nr:hypothetical protein [Hyphomicrobiales bacterium]
MADQDPPVFEPARSFVGWDAVARLVYVTGVLDAWYRIKRSGVPERWLFDCLYGSGEIEMTQLALQIVTTEAAKEAIDAGRGGASMIDLLVPKLKEVRTVQKKPDGADSR